VKFFSDPHKASYGKHSGAIAEKKINSQKVPLASAALYSASVSR
jgi:hypothetical protein